MILSIQSVLLWANMLILHPVADESTAAVQSLPEDRLASYMWGQAFCANANGEKDRARNIYLSAIQLDGCPSALIVDFLSCEAGPTNLDWGDYSSIWVPALRRRVDASQLSTISKVQSLDGQFALLAVAPTDRLQCWRCLALDNDPEVAEIAKRELQRRDSDNAFYQLCIAADDADGQQEKSFRETIGEVLRLKKYEGISVLPSLADEDFVNGFEFEWTRMWALRPDEVLTLSEVIGEQLKLPPGGPQNWEEHQVYEQIMEQIKSEQAIEDVVDLVSLVKFKAVHEESEDLETWLQCLLFLHRSASVFQGELSSSEQRYMDELRYQLEYPLERMRSFQSRLTATRSEQGEAAALKLLVNEAVTFRCLFCSLPEIESDSGGRESE